MSRPPIVNYSATSLRPSWSALPSSLRRAVAAAIGVDIAIAGPPVSSGFTGGFAAPIKLVNGRVVFVKACGDSMNAHFAYQREATLVPHLPPAAGAPQVLATAYAAGQDAEWFAVIFEHVAGRMPGIPWTPQDFATVTTTCLQMAEVLTSSPLPGLDPYIDGVLRGDLPSTHIAKVRSGDQPFPSGYQPWLKTRLAELHELVDLAPEALRGNAAVHGDLRPDNLLIDETGQCWTLDWTWLTLGPRWIDWAGLLPLAHRDHIDTLTAVHANPLTADVPAEYLDSFAATNAAYLLSKADTPHPPDCTPELRRHQRLYAWLFLDWLAERRGW